MIDIQLPFHKSKLGSTTYLQDQRPILEIGDFTYTGRIRVINYEKTAPVTKIGKFCSIANDCVFTVVQDHPYEFVTTFPLYLMLGEDEIKAQESFLDSKASKVDPSIEIGNDVWMGRGAQILSGVRIGDGAIIGANSVVAKNIPPYAIAVGNPVRIIRYRFTENEINQLLHIEWWNWPLEKIKENICVLNSANIRQLLKNNQLRLKN
jgi:acetyltransferase-like isoleucine patch superfamily enzyme